MLRSNWHVSRSPAFPIESHHAVSPSVVVPPAAKKKSGSQRRRDARHRQAAAAKSAELDQFAINATDEFNVTARE